MPFKPKKPCNHPGCPQLAVGNYCELHAKLHANDRASAGARGYNGRWRKASKRFLRANPLCKLCQREGKLVKAEVVDHIEPHRGNQELFWDESNWQALCKKCHDRKTRMEDQHPEYAY